jgi:hypothetical protein
MADNQKGIPFNSEDEGKDIPSLIKKIVYDAACELRVKDEHPTFSIDEVYVVWFAFTLGNWKALASTSLPDGRYYEVTYRVNSGRAFVDTYIKTHNKIVEIKEN